MFNQTKLIKNQIERLHVRQYNPVQFHHSQVSYLIYLPFHVRQRDKAQLCVGSLTRELKILDHELRLLLLL